MQFEVYNDKVDEIIIYHEGPCNAFTINGQKLNCQLVGIKDKIYQYKANLNLDLNTFYYVCDDKFNQSIVQYRYIVKSSQFDDTFYYDGDDLGSHYSKDYTTFKVWAPISECAYLVYFIDGIKYVSPMVRQEKGTYFVKIDKDMENALYYYLLKTNGKFYETNDIYSYSSNMNSLYSAVINLEKVAMDLNETVPDPLQKYTDAVIYELSVRDFSSNNSLGNDVNGKFIAFSKNGLKSKDNHPIGIDYLQFLGISHVQLMPVTDFVTTDESNPSNSYNWGYDPATYNVLEGSYSTNPNDPYCRIIEFKKLISSLHSKKIRVNLDLVFNHMYFTEANVYNKLVPYYFFQIDENLNYSNGSFCGNDVDTTRKMVKKYFLDIVLRYVNEYKIDGIRFDLMGIMDYELVNEIYQKCSAINSSFMVYGEGWNMPSMLNHSLRASLNNHSQMKNIAFFNDIYRDNLKGSSNENNLDNTGYINGSRDKASIIAGMIKGSIDSGYSFASPSQSINYAECHDNITLFDKLTFSNPNQTNSEKQNIILCCMAIILFSQGIPFIHGGQELCRSKNNNTNSYKSGDKINTFPWKNIDKYFDNALALKGLISLRKKYNIFRLVDNETIKNHFSYEILEDCVLKIKYNNLKDIDNISELVILINPNPYIKKFNFDDYYKLIASEHAIINEDIYVLNILMNPFSLSIYIKE